jgi:Ca2+-binding EF-hand superfamily protein
MMNKVSFTAMVLCLGLSSCGTIGYATEDAFNKFDLNKDGYLSKDEYKKINTSVAANAKEKKEADDEAEAEFNASDTNKDGRVSQREFLDSVMKHMKEEEEKQTKPSNKN